MRPIDADKMKSIKSIQSANFNSIESIREWIDEQPTADAVEVVRCKDCKYRQEDAGMGDHRWCDIVNGSRCSDDFCSYGKRKTMRGEA